MLFVCAFSFERFLAVVLKSNATDLNDLCKNCNSFQVTGEAEYADDMPMPPNGLHAALVLSRKPHARILSIDDSGAKSSPGFAGIFFHKDVPGGNTIGPVVNDEEIFASEFVTFVGQVQKFLT